MSKSVWVLTSSRADFGIYRPLLKVLQEDPNIKLKLLVFGAHLYKSHGYTINEIEKEGYDILEKIYHPLKSDQPEAVSNNIGEIIQKFSAVWLKRGSPELLISLGDRFEMFAAVVSTIPFQIDIAHIHGGETTLGAIDNTFRHAISLASKYHFCANKKFKEKLIQLLDSSEYIYNVGALSLDNLSSIKLLNEKDFKNKFGLVKGEKTVLVTFHPETKNEENNIKFTASFKNLVKEYSNCNFWIGLPNADTFGQFLRNEFITIESMYKNVQNFEHLGTQGYFSAINLSDVVFGNSSSGIIEVASLKKRVVNVGKRQKGRVSSENTIHCDLMLSSMKKALNECLKAGIFNGENKYLGENKQSVAKSIHKQLSKILF